MKKYIEIELKAGFYMPYHVLLSKVIQQLHFGFVNNKTLGISFPQYSLKRHTLGDSIRLFGTTEELQQFDIVEVLNQYADNVIISEILDVPEKVKTYASFSRYRYNYGNTYAGLARAARRKAKRSDMSYDEAFEYLKSFNIDEPEHLPFVSIKSVSTGGIFRLYVNYTECSAEKVVEEFNSYGLSAVNTVPMF